MNDQRDQAAQTDTEPPMAGDEAATLLGFLERQRATFAWKTAGPDAAGLRAALAPSSMTLGGLLKSPETTGSFLHLYWLSERSVAVNISTGGEPERRSPLRGRTQICPLGSAYSRRIPAAAEADAMKKSCSRWAARTNSHADAAAYTSLESFGILFLPTFRTGFNDPLDVAK